MTKPFDPEPSVDPSLWALAQLARHYRLACCADTLAHEFAQQGQPLSLDQFQHAARSAGFDTQVQRGRGRLHRLPLPAIGYDRENRPFVLWRRCANRTYIQYSGDAKPFAVSHAGLSSRCAGATVLLRPAAPQPSPERTALQWCWPVLRKYHGSLGRVLLAGVCLLAFSLVTPLFFQVVMDHVLVHRSLPTLAVMMTGLLAVMLFETLFSAARYGLFAHPLARIDAELKAGLFEHLLTVVPSFFAQRPVGEIAARMRELDTVRDFLTHHSLTVVLDGLFSLVFLAMMLLYSPALTAIVAVSLVAYATLALGWGPVLRHLAEQVQVRAADDQGFLVESLNAVRTLKGIGAERWTADQWDARITQAVQAQRRLGLSAAFAQESIGLVSKLVTAAILWWGVQAVMAGQLSVGSFIAFSLFANRVVQPALRMGQVWAQWQQAQVALQRLSMILEQPTQARLGITVLPRLTGHIALQSLCFRYDQDRPWALEDLNLVIESGQCIGITGASGSGKSTLLKLLLGFAALDKGTVRLDGHDIATADMASLRRQIGVVTQHPFLFKGSVHDNIALACPGAGAEQVRNAARLAGADAFIQRLPGGYQAPLTEAAGNLSGGQRQRIAIARALLTNPPILLFDEATSALDAQSQTELLNHLPTIARGRTMIMIAHRLETLTSCDRIVVLSEGRLVEQGTPAELAAMPDGHYARLLHIQQEEYA
ncbi:hypothetical protein LK03_08820 [Pseudomonas cremoricolorata]|uniref:Peptidase C39 n=2 Tax=Pseudomonas cremoricolorata TaxID=157783 RepID=A0A089WJ67_9PSED|nr:hypothetical protein LK03_08820 [Pseudomonas cremoricolorata]